MECRSICFTCPPDWKGRLMTSRERVLAAFAREEPDRVPVNYLSNAGIDRRLKEHFGLALDDHDGLLKALDVDFRGAGAPYVGPPLHEPIPDRQIDIWGIHTRWIEHPSGGYWDYCDFPLQDASLEEVEAWPMPSPDDFDYSGVAADCARHEGYCVVAGGAGCGDIINSTGMVRTMEQVLVDLMTGEEAGLRLIERRQEILLETMRRTLQAGEGKFDVLWIGEDLGTQRSPLISLDLYRERIRPFHANWANLGRDFGIPVMCHTCGSSSWAYDDFVDMGISIVDTLQPEAANMSPAYLKGRYGDRLAFHGCISTAGALAYGTVDDVVADVRATLEVMMPGGGYALAPTHCIQDNSPTENVLAMYEAAREYGQY